jgi:hypothetical protein
VVTEVAALRNVVSTVPRGIWQAVAMPAGAHRVARMAHAIDLDGGFDAVWHGRL